MVVGGYALIKKDDSVKRRWYKVPEETLKLHKPEFEQPHVYFHDDGSIEVGSNQYYLEDDEEPYSNTAHMTLEEFSQWLYAMMQEVKAIKERNLNSGGRNYGK